jgi:hypothetical protein
MERYEKEEYSPGAFQGLRRKRAVAKGNNPPGAWGMHHRRSSEVADESLLI